MWRIKSFGSLTLDSTSYLSFLKEGDNPNILPGVTDTIVKRGAATSMITGYVREVDTLKVTIVVSDTNFNTLRKNLAGALDNRTTTLQNLVIKADGSTDQWYVKAKPAQLVQLKRHIFQATFTIPDRIWRKAVTPIAWNVTSSPATRNVTNAGNQRTYPKFTFKPTTAKGNGFLYRTWVPIFNPNTDRAFRNWGFDLSAGGVNTTGWVADNANKCQVNNGGRIDASQTTIPYDTVTGSMPNAGMGKVDSEQIAWTGKTGTTSGNLTGCTRGVGGTTAATHADNAEIKLSYVQNNGNDLRFYVDGLEQNFWVIAFNSAATKLWFSYNGAPGISLTLAEAIAGSGDVDTIEFANTHANVKALNSMPNSGTLRIDNEAFAYWGKDLANRILRIDARAVKDTSMGAHTIGDVAYLIEHDAWLYSGNPTMDARVNNDTKKPILDLTNSSNATRVYAEFRDSAGLRAGSWKFSVIHSSNPDEPYRATRFYTGDHTDETADPATEVGLRMMSIYKSNRWQFENGAVEGTLYEPAGIDQVTAWSYEKYRTGPSWPTAALQKSKEGLAFLPVAAIASPASAGSWGAPITTGPPFVMGTGYYHLRFYFGGTISAGSSGGVGYEVDIELNSITYTTVAPPTVQIMTRNDNSYELNSKLTNNANDQYFRVVRTMKINDEIEVDCALKTVTNKVDGQRIRSAIFVPDNQMDWMSFLAGVNGLTYRETGAAGILVTVEYDDMLAV